MKAAIYDPYLDTLGGGEKYTLTVAETMLTWGWSVDLFWSKDPSWLTKAQQRFFLNLDHLNIIPDPFASDLSPDSRKKNLVSFRRYSNPLVVLNRLQKIKSITSQYDYLFFLTDGSLPSLFAKNNFLHFQVPFHSLSFSPAQKILNKFRLKRIRSVICNSAFTKNLVDQTYGVKSYVLYPPIDINNFKPQEKKDFILSVARFDNLFHSKRQDILISAFKKIIDRYRPPWKLILAGSSRQDPLQNTYLMNLKHSARDYPIEFVVNQDFSTIQKLYAQAKIFWHATGFDVDETKNPHLVEHFGMTIVEAMAAGLVPVVIKKGGIKEIICHEKNGYLWETEEKLLAYTKLLMDNDTIRQKLAQKAQERSKDFSKENFVSHLKNLLNLSHEFS